MNSHQQPKGRIAILPFGNPIAKGRREAACLVNRCEKFMMTNNLPILPLRDVVVYPHMVVPMIVGRSASMKALEISLKNNKQIFLVAQKDSTVEHPKSSDLYYFGTIANVMQLLKLPDNTIKVLVEGVHRGRVLQFIEQDGVTLAEVEMVEDVVEEKDDFPALFRLVTTRFDDYVKINRKIPAEVAQALAEVTIPGRAADAISVHLPLRMEERQKVLETVDAYKRLELVAGFLESELDLLHVEERVQNRVRTQVDKTQREFYLHEKLKAVQKELDELGEGKYVSGDLDKMRQRIEEAGLSAEAKEKALAELNKLKLMLPMSPDAAVVRNYLDWLLNLPWQKQSEVNKDLTRATTILEEDHYGLEKVKERIIEYLAVQQRVSKIKGPILCLVGPPGVGKTSLGRSIARATGREFVRVSLGGVRDEAEIRGHRRTYVGALPGKILQKMAKVKVKNPLFMLDEVDKMAMDFRGDPASALLEVLDPEQNHAFNDHYLEVDYDLSHVMFIATANSLNIPPALLDRMEVIRLAGYTEDEKMHIAKRYLIPKQIKENGLGGKEIDFSDEALRDIIRYYTREAGVRNLEREIAKICRKVVKELLTTKIKKIAIDEKNSEKYLGVRIYHFGLADKKYRIGQVYGLAWTEVGGDLLTIEVAVVRGKGQALYTGHLGEVMQESIRAALTVVRSRAAQLKLEPNFYAKNDIHVHVPEGATPKDGPSAGIGMCTAIVSAFTHIPVRSDVAMTGEITLRGEVLPIGGLKEKLLAALRGGIKTVIIPEGNVKDLKELPANITANLTIKPVRSIDQVLELALEASPLKSKSEKRGRKSH